MKNSKYKKLLLVVTLATLLMPLAAFAVDNPAPTFFISLPDNTVRGILTFVIQALLGLAGTLSMLFIIVGGFQYITSGMNEKQAESGKKTLTNAIIGLVIVVLSYTIVVVVINTFK
jgi:hypothetical protein